MAPTDPTGAVVPNATVTVTNTATSQSAHAATNAEGAFEAPSVPVGAYQVTVKRDGFAPSAGEVVVASGSAPVAGIVASLFAADRMTGGLPV